MSAAAATTTARPEPPRPLVVYRDDGPVGAALGGVAAPAVRLPPVALVAAGVLPLIVAVAAAGGDASEGLAALVVGWLVLLGGASSGREDTSRFRWLSPPLLRLAEYAALLWLGSIAGGSGVAAAFALLAAVAFRHYDLVYRLRHRSVAPPRWVSALGLGWDGRLLVALVLLLLGGLTAGLFVLAAVLGTVFAVESALGWSRAGRGQEAQVYEDEEDEGA